jgi:hypothetical protein
VKNRVSAEPSRTGSATWPYRSGVARSAQGIAAATASAAAEKKSAGVPPIPGCASELSLPTSTNVDCEIVASRASGGSWEFMQAAW